MCEEFIRLHLSELTNFDVSENIVIIKYDSKIHHDLIPLLYSEGFNDNPWSNDWDNIKEFDSDGVFLLRDKNKDIYIGFAISFNRDNYGYISVVTILPKYRNNGYARILLKQCVKYLKSIGIKEIIIDVKADNIIALNLYKKIGFKEYK